MFGRNCTSRIAVTGLLLFAAAGAGGFAQSSKSAQPLYLPDPTPRPPDLQREYENKPTDDAARQRAAMSLETQRRALVIRASNELVILAEELNAGIAKIQKGGAITPNAQTAEAIERLAKNVKEAIKAQ